MAWREKLAWLSLGATLLAYATYFTLIAHSPPTIPGMLARLAAVIAFQVVVMAAGGALLAATAPADARARPDERDRAIDRQATRIAYLVLLTGTILVGVVLPLGTADAHAAAARISNAALLAIVTAELVRYAITIIAYRRGGHG